MMHKHKGIDASGVLREKGFRLTVGRLKLLSLLEHSGKPLSIKKILSSWKGKIPDTATLYRSLTDLTASGIVRRIDLNTGVAHFEYTPDRPHHHHVVCTGCGSIEEIEECSVDSLQKKILRESTQFTKINTHNLEFFGECNKCIQV
jgi:Fur family transcriptional regulator, ferric uptake regulator